MPGVDHPVPTVWTEAGVVTQRVADAAERGGLCLRWTRPRPKPRALAATSP
jgi:FAD/FMN-containing dehydrogenase